MTELDRLDDLLEKEKNTIKELSLKLIQQNDELIQVKSDNESINNELNYTYDELDKCKEQYEEMIEGLEVNFSNLMKETEEKHKNALEEIELRRAMQYVELNRKLEKIEHEHQQEKDNLNLKMNTLKKPDDNGNDENDETDMNSQIMNVLSLVHVGLQKIEGQCLDLSSRASDSSPRYDSDAPDNEFFEPEVPTITHTKINHTVTGIFSKQKSIFELIQNLFIRVFSRSPMNLQGESKSLSPSSPHSDTSYDMQSLSQSLVDTKVQLAELHSDNLELQLKYSNLEKYCWYSYSTIKSKKIKIILTIILAN